jgi:VanZ family protein
MILKKKFIPGIAWFFLVLLLMCLPGSSFPKTDDWLQKIFFDKWVHVGIFGMLAYLFMLPFIKSDLTNHYKRNIIIKIAIASSVWGFTTELIQKYLVIRRSFDILDWVADTVGILIVSYYFLKKIKVQEAK